jgi:hypothetical protein
MATTTTTSTAAAAALGTRPVNSSSSTMAFRSCRLSASSNSSDSNSGGCGSTNPPDSVPAAAARRLEFGPALPAANAPLTSASPLAIPDQEVASVAAPLSHQRSAQPPQPPPQQQQQQPLDPTMVRLLNLNVFAGSPLPFYQNYTSTQSLEGSRRLRLQIEKIKELAPDIVTLQEVCADGVERCVLRSGGLGRGRKGVGRGKDRSMDGRMNRPTFPIMLRSWSMDRQMDGRTGRWMNRPTSRPTFIVPTTLHHHHHHHHHQPNTRFYKEALGKLGYDAFSESQPPEALGLALLYLIYALLAGILSFALHLSIDVLGMWSPASASAALLWRMWWGERPGSSIQGALVVLALFLKSLVLSVLLMRKTCLAGFLGGTVKASMVIFWRRDRLQPWRAQATDGKKRKKKKEEEEEEGSQAAAEATAAAAAAAAAAGTTTLFSEQRGDWLNLVRPRGYLTMRLSFAGLSIWVVNTHLNLGAWQYRRRQIEQIMAHCRRLGESGSVLLCGDFNATPESEEVRAGGRWCVWVCAGGV